MLPLPLASNSPYCDPLTLTEGTVSYFEGKLCSFLDQSHREIVFSTSFDPLGCYALQFWVCAIDQVKKIKVDITDGTNHSTTPYTIEPGVECLKVLFFNARVSPSHTITFRLTDLAEGQLRIEQIYIEKMITAIGGDCQVKVKTVEDIETTIPASEVDPANHLVYHPFLDRYDTLVEKRRLEYGESIGRYVKICHSLEMGYEAYNFIVAQNSPILIDNTPFHVHTPASWNDFHGGPV